MRPGTLLILTFDLLAHVRAQYDLPYTYNTKFVNYFTQGKLCSRPALSDQLYCQIYNGDTCGVLVRQTNVKSMKFWEREWWANFWEFGFSAYGCFYIDDGYYPYVDYTEMCTLFPEPRLVLYDFYEPMGVGTIPRGDLSLRSGICQQRANLAEQYLAGDLAALNYQTTPNLEDYARLTASQLEEIRCTPEDETKAGVDSIWPWLDYWLDVFQCTVNGCVGAPYIFYPPSPPPAPIPNGWICNDDCSASGDGFCDDGGPGSEYGFCDEGSDCVDCGARAP